MANERPVTEVQKRNAAVVRRRRVMFGISSAIIVLGALAFFGAVFMAAQLLMTYGRSHPGITNHYKYGSIGAELANGLPYRIFVALPKVFPEYFGLSDVEAQALTEQDAGKAFRHFGLLFDPGDEAVSKGLPVGFATGVRMGQEVAWFNCAVCHAGQVKLPGSNSPVIVLGMPANTANLEKFFHALFDMAVDKRFSWQDETFRRAVGAERMWWFERILWEWGIVPYTRSVLIRRRSELLPLLDPLRAGPQREQVCKPFPEPSSSSYRSCGDLKLQQPPPHDPQRPETPPTPWGPGRVDTFNPYKLIHFNVSADCLKAEERTGFADFPSVFLQRPRGDKMMNLHWDGNNASLKERNLSAALGAGVTPESVRHRSIERVAEWLEDLRPPPSPYTKDLDLDQVARGKSIYQRECADCHGYQDGTKYVFEGARLGSIEPIAYIGTDRGRLDSYTSLMEKFQKDQLFCNSPRHRFRHFKKTGGYANLPLDGLWLRAPYLHNGSVPTLRDLLAPPADRPARFLRGRIELDPEKGGFKSPACDAATKPGVLAEACFDTTRPGNSNNGHTYGTDLPEESKNDLLQYLLTF